jgi:hypothetical protein
VYSYGVDSKFLRAFTSELEKVAEPSLGAHLFFLKEDPMAVDAKAHTGLHEEGDREAMPERSAHDATEHESRPEVS